MSVSPDKQLEAVKTILEAAKDNPEILDALRKPSGSSKGSNYSYYNRDTGTMVKRIVDIMLADTERKDQELYTKDFKTVSRNSLQMRLWQGFKYLVERMDTADGKYTKARQQIAIRKSGNGIKFCWKDHEHIMPTAVLPAPRKKEWKDEFDTFLDTAKGGDMFHRKDVDLEDEDIEYIRRSIVNFPEFRVFKLKQNEIKIGKTI